MMEKKTKIILSIILALIPVVSFILQYTYSVQTNTMDEFRHNYAPYYYDFLFVIFNALVLSAARINWKTIGWIFVASLIVMGLVNYLFWTFQFDVGIVHLAFAAMEISLLIAAIFSKAENKMLYIIMMIPVIVYFVLSFLTELFIYRPVVILEALPHLIGLFVVILRLGKSKFYALGKFE